MLAATMVVIVIVIKCIMVVAAATLRAVQLYQWYLLGIFRNLYLWSEKE